MRITSLLQLIIYAIFISISSLTYAGPGKNDPKPGSNSIKYIDKSNMDLSVKPGDNFYLYANGNWLKNNPVPASKTRWEVLMYCAKKARSVCVHFWRKPQQILQKTELRR